MARFPKKEPDIIAFADLAQAMESDIYYAKITVNKTGDSEPSNTAMAVL